MATPYSSLKAPVPSTEAPSDTSVAHARQVRMTGRNRALFFLTAWLIVLMPFLFWWGTWFGRPLSDKQIGEYLNDEKHPRHIQHALVQLGDRMARRDGAAKRWYPDIARLAAHRVEEVRNTDAWVMGQDTASQSFHDALLNMLQDPSIIVRGNAGLSLVRFGDPSGRSQIVALLKPAKILAPAEGSILDAGKPGTAIHQGGSIAKFGYGFEQTTKVLSPISGRIRSIDVPTGVIVTAGTEIATVDPNEDQVWEAVRALYLIGQPDDLPAIRPYERELPGISDRVRQQAALAENAILERAKKQP